MPLDVLKKGIVFAMKNNLMVQYVLPSSPLPIEYFEVLNTIDHHVIAPIDHAACDILDSADVIVVNNIADVSKVNFVFGKSYVIRIAKNVLYDNCDVVKDILNKTDRLNVVICDMEIFSSEDIVAYQQCLESLSDELVNLYSQGRMPQLNLLTDRLFLDVMNNCGAGDSSITLAPDGKYYICPAFYQAPTKSRTGIDNYYSVGDIDVGILIKNRQLYSLKNAPLCSMCDAFHCRRCVWINRMMTNEVHIPSREQCIMAHVERNMSRKLLCDIRDKGSFLPEKEIKQIDYIDPFDVKPEW